MATEQEEFWQGEFGDEYVIRNDLNSIGARTNLLSKVVSKTREVDSVYEVGTNIGLNLDALKILLPNVSTNGCEINKSAFEKVVAKGHNVENASVFDANPGGLYDLVFTNGVMIHINPEKLCDLYSFMGRISRRYILIHEYFSPSPVEVAYRGHSGKLFKRDFAKEIMDHCGLKLVDYGFTWRHDPVFPIDDSNWFLLEK